MSKVWQSSISAGWSITMQMWDREVEERLEHERTQDQEFTQRRHVRQTELDQQERARDMDRDQRERDRDQRERTRDMDRDQRERDRDQRERTRDMDRDQRERDRDQRERDREVERDQRQRDRHQRERAGARESEPQETGFESPMQTPLFRRRQSLSLKDKRCLSWFACKRGLGSL